MSGYIINLSGFPPYSCWPGSTDPMSVYLSVYIPPIPAGLECKALHLSIFRLFL
jgi:hypothetical protein